jgi:hypothetical protein
MEACFSHKTTSTGKGFVALDDFRFRHRMPSRAATIRKILRAGLGVVEKLASGGTHSSDFGVVHRSPVRHRASR